MFGVGVLPVVQCVVWRLLYRSGPQLRALNGLAATTDRRHEVLKFCWSMRRKNEADLQGGAQGDNGGKIEFDNSLYPIEKGKKIGFFWCRCVRVSRTLYWYSIFLYARNIYVHVAASLFIQKKRHELTPVSCVVFCHFFFMYTVIR